VEVDKGFGNPSAKKRYGGVGSVTPDPSLRESLRSPHVDNERLLSLPCLGVTSGCGRDHRGDRRSLRSSRASPPHPASARARNLRFRRQSARGELPRL